MWSLFTSIAAGSVVARVLLALGVGFVSYVGFNSVLGLATDMIHDMFSEIPMEPLMIMGLADVDLFINIVLSAYSARIALMSVSALRFGK